MARETKGTRRWLYGLGALALAFFLVNVFHFGRLPLRIEEREWPPMAEAILDSGKPVINYDETRRIQINPDLKVDKAQWIGAWHPPLFLYLGAVEMAITGSRSPYWLRTVGVVGLLCAALLLLLIAREVTSRWRLVGGVAAILLLIHPYAIQASVFLDIDTTVYTPVALLALWVAIRLSKRAEALGPLQVLAIGATLALVTWAKMPTTIVLVGVLVVWWLFSRRPLPRAVAEAVAFVATGAALFFSTYALWCKLTGIPFSYTFDVTFVQKSNRLFSEMRIVEHAIHWHLRWFGAAVLILAAIYLIGLLRNLFATRRLRPLDLPFLFGFGVLVTYAVLSPTDSTYQGKYAFPALASLLLPISWMLLEAAKRQKVRWWYWPVAIAAGVVAVLVLPDEITHLAEFNILYGSWPFELKLLAIAGAALGLAWLLGGRRGFSGGVIVVFAVLSIGQAIHSYRANTSPLYPIPDTNDFLAAVSDINHTVPRGDVVVTSKDMAIYMQRRDFEGEEAFIRGDGLEARAIRKYPEIVAFARDSFGPPVGPKTEAVLNHCFLERHEFGSASVVYRTRSCD